MFACDLECGVRRGLRAGWMLALFGVCLGGGAQAQTPVERFLAHLETRKDLPAEAAQLIRETWSDCQDCDAEEFLIQGLALLSPPFRAGLVDTTIRRYLKSAVPVDSTIDSMVIFAVARDAGGNVDTASRRVNIVRGPNVVINIPRNGDSVPQGVGMSIAVRAQHADGVRDVTVRVQGETNWPTRLDTSMVSTIESPTRSCRSA